MGFFTCYKDVFTDISCVATSLGVFLALITFWIGRAKDRRQQEKDTYTESSERYVDYLKLCLQRPDLGCAEFTEGDDYTKDTGFSVDQLLMFSILISMLEVGYVKYKNHSGGIKETQWHGWENYIRFWATRADFRKAWTVLSPGYDEEFKGHVTALIAKKVPPNELAALKSLKTDRVPPPTR